MIGYPQQSPRYTRKLGTSSVVSCVLIIAFTYEHSTTAHLPFIPSVSLFLLPNAKAIDFTTRIRNQFLPFWCGSCWVSVCCYSTRNHRCISCTPLVFQNLLKMILMFMSSEY